MNIYRKTIQENIEKGVYKAQAPYVRIKRFQEPKPDQIIGFMKNNPKLNYDDALEQMIKNLKEEEATTKSAQELYWKEDNACIQQFKNDLDEFSEIKGNPLLEIIKTLTWEQGHANGFSAILECFENHLEAFKKITDNYDLLPKKKQGNIDTHPVSL